jgi:broad-specificity NMP kinase
MDAEIFGTLLEEAKEAFDKEIVIELSSEDNNDIDSNCERIALWIESWKKSDLPSVD